MFQETGDRIVVFLSDADLRGDREIERAARELYALCSRAAESSKLLIVDFRGVESFSSAMLGKLLTVSKRAKASRVKLRLTGMSEGILEMMKLVRLDELFREDDSNDGPDLLGSPVPNPKKPSSGSGRAGPANDKTGS